MIKVFLCVAMLLAGPVAAQDFTALARVIPEQSKILDGQKELAVSLQLTQAVPFRVRSYDAPMRIEVDFSEVDFTGLSAAMLMQSERISNAGFRVPETGWSRMTLELTEPMNVVSAGMIVSEETGQATLRVALQPVDKNDFMISLGAQSTTVSDSMTDADTPALPVVAIDPGHGGVDPGAEHGGVREANVMLALAIELAEAINRTGIMRAVLTRQNDTFVSLPERMTIARSASAVALLSLHADALEAGQARGASVYTLAKESLDGASERMAERHGRGDLVTGLDLTAQDDRVAGVLMDLARAETGPQGARLASAVWMACVCQVCGCTPENGERGRWPFSQHRISPVF